MPMKFEESSVWDDPFVRSIRKSVDVDMEAFNKISAVQALLSTDSLDPFTAGVLLAASGRIKGELPNDVRKAVETLNARNLLAEGPEYLFKADDTAALKIAMATLTYETTGAGFDKTKGQADQRRADVQKGIDIMAEIADRLVESGAHLAIEPKLVEKFAEGLDNMRQVEQFASRKKMLNEAASSLKYAMMQGNRADVVHHAPRIDPDSGYMRFKNDARTRFRL